MKILLEKIMPNPEQPRRNFDADELEGLAQSIRENGVIQPVSVEEASMGTSGTFYILHDGERRCRAARMAGLTEIEAMIRPSSNGSGAQERLVRALVANIQRQDLNPIEEGRAFEQMQKMGMTMAQIAKKLGKNLAMIDQRLVLMRLDIEIQELIEAGKFPSAADVARALLKIPTHTERIGLARELARRRSSNNACKLAAEYLAKRLATPIEKKQAQRALRMAMEKRAPDRKHWDMLHQAGRLPAWEIVENSARTVCGRCVLYDMASEAVCCQCPAVFLLIEMIAMSTSAMSTSGDGK